MTTFEPEITGAGRRVAVVASRFNHPISLRLLDGCLERLSECGCGEVDVCWVPGAFELPLCVKTVAQSGRYDAVVAIGVVIQGGTPHFDYVCSGVTDGLRQVTLETRVPVAFCVLTTDTVEQALERAARAGEKGSNKGAEAADVALEMAALLDAIGGQS